jgi:3-hydroxyisobutyrate dehydrogenase-like beta-hydroxyacid dehydrogenase
MSTQPGIAVIGFGEAGGLIAAGLATQGFQVKTWDILFVKPEAHRLSGKELEAKASAAQVVPASSLGDAIEGAVAVFSAVTASESEHVAQKSAHHLKAPQIFIDINSVSPGTKQRNQKIVEVSGARYVDAAVMAPVLPYGLAVPMLLGGAAASEVKALFEAAGMRMDVVAAEIGHASAIKMCRSVMIKGLEALTVESMYAARHYGVEDAVLASLHESFPSLGWNKDLPDYLISRVVVHGRRRAAEMREVAATISEAGIAPLMSSSIAERQDELANIAASGAIGFKTMKDFSWRETFDTIAKGKSLNSGGH